MSPFNGIMNEITRILNSNTSEETVNKLIYYISAQDKTAGLLALCSMLMIEKARRFHAEARYEELEREFEKLKKASS